MRLNKISLCMAYIIMSVSLAACSGINLQINPFGPADSLEQRAFAAYGAFVVAEEQAVILVRDKRIPVSVRKAIQQADRVAKPAADALLQAAVIYQRATVKSDGDLLQAIEAFGPKLHALLTAIRQSKPQAWLILPRPAHINQLIILIA